MYTERKIHDRLCNPHTPCILYTLLPYNMKSAYHVGMNITEVQRWWPHSQMSHFTVKLRFPSVWESWPWWRNVACSTMLGIVLDKVLCLVLRHALYMTDLEVIKQCILHTDCATYAFFIISMHVLNRLKYWLWIKANVSILRAIKQELQESYANKCHTCINNAKCAILKVK